MAIKYTLRYKKIKRVILYFVHISHWNCDVSGNWVIKIDVKINIFYHGIIQGNLV